MKIYGNQSRNLLGLLDTHTAPRWSGSSGPFTLNNCEGSLLFFTSDIPENLFQGLNFLGIDPDESWHLVVEKLFNKCAIHIPVRSSLVESNISLQQLVTKNSVIGDWYFPPEGITTNIRQNNAWSTGNLNGLRVSRHKINLGYNINADVVSGFTGGRNMPIRSSAYNARGSLLNTQYSSCGLVGSSYYYNAVRYTLYNLIKFDSTQKFNWFYVRKTTPYSMLWNLRYWNASLGGWREVNTNNAYDNSQNINIPASYNENLFRFPERETNMFLTTTRINTGQVDAVAYAQTLVAGHTDPVYNTIPESEIKWCIYIQNLNPSPLANGLVAGNLSNYNLSDTPLCILPVGDADSDAPIRLDSLNIGHTDQPQTKQLVYGRIKLELR